jgi:methylisocitrate lyase
VHGLDEAVRRAAAFAEAGAHLVFVEGARTVEQLAAVHAAAGAPQVLNRSEAGAVDDLDDATLREVGVELVLHPVSALLAMAAAARTAYRAIAQSCSARGVERLDWDELTDLLGLPQALAQEARAQEVPA